ncbi:MAG: adenosylhomocysteinase [Candidatus Geothermarchaeales archaeon]
MSIIRHPERTEKGRMAVDWASARMPAIGEILEKYREASPLQGVKVSGCLHVTKETGVLVKALKELGADVALAASNPLSTQDEVAAHLSDVGIHVYAFRGETRGEYLTFLAKIADFEPDIVIDDGGDAHVYLHEERQDLLQSVVGGTEETTTGITRLRALSDAGKLAYPVMAVNNARTKRIFDNRYGTGQSTIEGILRSTSLLLGGKVFVVCGFGYVGRGIAERARGMGAMVVVTEVDSLRALEAHIGGFSVMSLGEAAKVGDIFVTATGQTDVIRKEHFELMKDGAILANSGHFNVEISTEDLESIALTRKEGVREFVDEYVLEDGRRLYLLGQGRLINLVAAEGHPPEVMMSSFSNQILSVMYLVENDGGLDPKVYDIPKDIDNEVTEFVLKGWGIEKDTLTDKQSRYAKKWR